MDITFFLSPPLTIYAACICLTRFELLSLWACLQVSTILFFIWPIDWGVTVMLKVSNILFAATVGPLIFSSSTNSESRSTDNILHLKLPLNLLMSSTSSSGKIRSTGSYRASRKAATKPWFYHSLISFETWPRWALLALAAAPTMIYLPLQKSCRGMCVLVYLRWCCLHQGHRGGMLTYGRGERYGEQIGEETAQGRI